MARGRPATPPGEPKNDPFAAQPPSWAGGDSDTKPNAHTGSRARPGPRADARPESRAHTRRHRTGTPRGAAIPRLTARNAPPHVPRRAAPTRKRTPERDRPPAPRVAFRPAATRRPGHLTYERQGRTRPLGRDAGELLRAARERPPEPLRRAPRCAVRGAGRRDENAAGVRERTGGARAGHTPDSRLRAARTSRASVRSVPPRARACPCGCGWGSWGQGSGRVARGQPGKPRAVSRSAGQPVSR